MECDRDYDIQNNFVDIRDRMFRTSLERHVRVTDKECCMNFTKGNLAWLLLGLMLPPLSACAAILIPPYSAEAIEARVIDAETKQPLESVVVTANWELRGGGLAFGGSSFAGQLMVMEAVTDKNGKFHFPAWGPIRQFKGQLLANDPRLIFFKSGYQHLVLSNDYLGNVPALEAVHRSQWNGNTIELKPFKGTVEEYAKRLEFLATSLESLLSEECGWKKIPHMILVVSEQSEIFRQRRLYALPSVESLEVRYSNSKSQCGSVKEFFQSYKP